MIKPTMSGYWATNIAGRNLLTNNFNAELLASSQEKDPGLKTYILRTSDSEDAEAKDKLGKFFYYKHSNDENEIYNIALASILLAAFIASQKKAADFVRDYFMPLN